MTKFDSDNTTEVVLRIPPRDNLLWGVTTRWFGLGVSIILGLIIAPVIIRTLGNESYGLWGLAASFLSFYGLFDFGIRSAVSRFFGNAIGAKDIKQFNRVASSGIWLLTAASVLIIVFAIIIIKPACSILHIPPEHVREFSLLIILTAVSVSTTVITSVFGGVLLASEDFVWLTCADTAATIVRSIGGVSLILAGKGVVSLAAVNVATNILQQFVTYLRSRKRFPQMKAGFSHFDYATAKALMGFGIATYVAMIADTLRSRFDVMLVTRFAGLDQAGLYTLALTPFRYISNAILSVAGITWPRLNNLQGTGERLKLQEFFNRSSHITAACASLLTGLIVGLTPLLFRIWVGPGKDESATVLRILMVGYFLDFATNPGIGSLYATARHKYFAVQTTIEGIASFTLAFILGAKFGMRGVAAGIVIPITIVKLTIQPWYVTRSLSVCFWKYWLRTIAMASITTGVLSLCLFPVDYCMARWGWWTAPLIITGAMAVSSSILWLCVLDGEDRKRVIFNLKNAAGKLALSKYGLKISSNPEAID